MMASTGTLFYMKKINGVQSGFVVLMNETRYKWVELVIRLGFGLTQSRVCVGLKAGWNLSDAYNFRIRKVIRPVVCRSIDKLHLSY